MVIHDRSHARDAVVLTNVTVQTEVIDVSVYERPKQTVSGFV